MQHTKLAAAVLLLVLGFVTGGLAQQPAQTKETKQTAAAKTPPAKSAVSAEAAAELKERRSRARSLLIALSSDARTWQRRHGITYPSVHDGSGNELTKWGGLPIPKIFFVDRSGKVVGELQAEEDLPRYLRQIASS